MAGFRFAYRLSGGSPTIQTLPFKDTETLTKGDLLNLEAGEVDLAATTDTNLLGVALETKAGTDSVSPMKVITDGDAVYRVRDNNARKKGDTLDIAGATGAQGVAVSSNKELVVQAPSTANEPTLVRVNVGKHHESKAQ